MLLPTGKKKLQTVGIFNEVKLTNLSINRCILSSSLFQMDSIEGILLNNKSFLNESKPSFMRWPFNSKVNYRPDFLFT